MENLTRQNATLRALDAAIAGGGVRLLLLLRLSPVVSFTLFNYFAGATRASLRDFVIASIGMIPGTVGYCYLGSLVSSASEIIAPTSNNSDESPAVRWVLLGVGLVATIAALLVIGRRAHAALRESLAAQAATEDPSASVGVELVTSKAE